MRRIVLLALFVLAACGEPVEGNRFGNESSADAPDAVTVAAAPVRIGELGPSFEACAAAGTTRHVEPGTALPVRAAPFESAAAAGTIPAGGRFFICSRSLDQKWFGIVYDEAGGLAARCGVSDPVTARRAYDGPCRSGWVASAFVKVIAGDDSQPGPPPIPNQNEAAPAQTGP